MPKKSIVIKKDKKGRYVVLNGKKVYFGDKISVRALKALLAIGKISNMRDINIYATKKRKKQSKAQREEGVKMRAFNSSRALDMEKMKIRALMDVKAEQKTAEQPIAVPVVKEEKTMPALEPSTPVPKDIVEDKGDEWYHEREFKVDKDRIIELVEKSWHDGYSRQNKQQVTRILNKSFNNEDAIEAINDYAKRHELPTIEFHGSGKSSDDEGLSNHEIDRVMGKFKDYRGTISRDEIPLITKKVKRGDKVGFVMNTDRSDQKGEHWVAVYIDPKSEVNYFDSFGEDPQRSIDHDLKMLAAKVKVPGTPWLKLKINRVKHQHDSTDTCGFHAMKFLIDRMGRGKNFADASGYTERIEDKSGKYEREIASLRNTRTFNYL